MPTRLRMPRSALLGVVVLVVCAVPLAAVSPWLLTVFALPVLALAWVLRSGVDLDGEAVTVRAAFGAVRVPWEQVAGLGIGGRGQLSLVRTDGSSVGIPTLRVRDLPRLYDASQGRLGIPAEPAQ